MREKIDESKVKQKSTSCMYIHTYICIHIYVIHCQFYIENCIYVTFTHKIIYLSLLYRYVHKIGDSEGERKENWTERKENVFEKKKANIFLKLMKDMKYKSQVT